jgi:gamma-glutamylcyclotransferase (GGCT)/AIG2-like uncharacterized protein YtfP
MQGRLARSHPHRGIAQSKKPGEWICGEVFCLNDPGELLPILDEYEGPEYKRTAVTIQLDSGKRMRSWVYLYRNE